MPSAFQPASHASSLQGTAWPPDLHTMTTPRCTQAQSDMCRYGRLDRLVSSGVIRLNQALVWVVSRLHIAPRGLEDVHNMLVKVAVSLTDGGRSGECRHLCSATPQPALGSLSVCTALSSYSALAGGVGSV